MPRRRMPFSLVRRKIPLQSGKSLTIFYYRVRDENDKLRTFTTSKTTKTEATAYVMELYRTGKLIPEINSKVPTIQEYSSTFWVFEGPRVQSALLRKRLTPAYCNANHRTLELHWWPVHGTKRLDELTVRDIEAMITLKSKGDTKTGAKALRPGPGGPDPQGRPGYVGTPDGLPGAVQPGPLRQL